MRLRAGDRSDNHFRKAGSANSRHMLAKVCEGQRPCPRRIGGTNPVRHSVRPARTDNQRNELGVFGLELKKVAVNGWSVIAARHTRDCDYKISYELCFEI